MENPAEFSAGQDVVQIEIPQLEPSPVAYDMTNAPERTPHLHQPTSDKNADEKSAEYALHILFTQFVRYTERKLSALGAAPDENQIPINKALGEGSDPEFDKILSSLGHVARRKPKPVIDSVMYWRKSKSDQAAAAHSSAEQAQAERKSLVSIFILSRVLMQIVKQAPPEVLGDDLSEKLEDIVFKQLLTADPRSIMSNTTRRANWVLLSKLLGEMSNFRFASVDDRFISELEKVPPTLTANQEAKTELLLQAMKYLKIKLYPEENLEESANFLESIAKFYNKTSSSQLRDCYAEVLCSMFEPIAEIATAEVNHPVWASTVELFYNQAMRSMKRSWVPSFRLATMALCVSPPSIYATNWLSLLESQCTRQKSKWSSKYNLHYWAAAKLLWVFAFRCPESLNSTTRKLESIKKLLFVLPKKQWALLSSSSIMACLSILCSAFHAYPQYALDEIMFPMLTGYNATDVAKSRQIHMESVVRERALIAIYAFSCAVHNLRTGAKLPFPTSEYLSRTPAPFFDTSKFHNKPVSGSLEESIELFGSTMCQLIGIIGGLNESKEESSSRQNSVSQIVGIHGNIGRGESNEDIVKAVIASIPWWSRDEPKYWEIPCRYVQSSISSVAATAAYTLKSIARLADVATLLNVFNRSLFAVDARFYTSYELSAPTEIEPYLRLYAELIELWVVRLKHEGSSLEEKSNDIALSTLWSTVEEIEGNGLFFLCSQDRELRTLALRILWLTSELENALQSYSAQKSNGSSERVISFLEKTDVTALCDQAQPRLELSVPERSRVTKFRAKKTMSIARLADSDYGVDSALWLKLFPLVISMCFERYPIAMAFCRNLVCARLVQMHDVVMMVAETDAHKASSIMIKHPMRTHAEVVVEQWRIYLMVACATLTTTDEQKLYVPNSLRSLGHGRKKSSQKITLHHQRITSARSIFKIVIPLLGTRNPAIRDAIILGISSINVNTYKTLLECFEPITRDMVVSLRKRQISPAPVSGFSHSQRAITEITNILRLTTHFLEYPDIKSDDWIRTVLSSILSEIYSVLTTSSVQLDYSFHSLRRYFCGLLEHVVTYLGPGVLSVGQHNHFLRLVEEWSSFGQYAASAAEREALMRRATLASAKDAQEQNVVLASIEFEKRKFDQATSRAFGALLATPVPKDQIEPVTKWLYALFASNQDALHAAGRIALANLLQANAGNPSLVRDVLGRCYSNSDKSGDVSKHYFFGLAAFVRESRNEERSVLQEIIPLALFKIGSQDMDVRVCALELLISVDKQLYGDSAISSFHYRVRSPTPAVYKREIFRISTELASSRRDETYTLFSSLTKAFHSVKDSDRRDIISALLPWLQNINFQPDNAVAGANVFDFTSDPQTLMVLVNLFELTVLFSDKIQHEMEALWVGLCTSATGTKNVHTVLDFLFKICLFNRHTGIMDFCRRVLAYLSGSLAEGLIVERLVRYLEPRCMISQTLKPFDMKGCKEMFPYVANCSSLPALCERMLGAPPESWVTLPPLSYGQLSTVFLADVIGNKDLVASHVPTIFHMCITMADHFIPIVQEKAIELLGCTVSLFVSPEAPQLQAFIQDISGSSSPKWFYDDMNLTSKAAGRVMTPDNMVKVIKDTVALMQPVMPDIQILWAAEAIKWATTCPVRHLACRSFQVFRCLDSAIDQRMLADMLARLSTTISESSPDIQGFSIQILMTLNSIADDLDASTLYSFPQLFWAAVASMGSTREREYMEALSIVKKFLQKWDFGSEEVVGLLRTSFPARWEGQFDGIQPLAFLGLRSSNAYELSQSVIEQLMVVPTTDLLVDKHFVPLALAANLPRFLYSMQSSAPKSVIASATHLQSLCKSLSEQIFQEGSLQRAGATSLTRILDSFVRGRFRSKEDFMQQYVGSLCVTFPESLSSVLIMMMGTLSNKLRWIRIETMSILKLLLPQVDLHNDDQLLGLGADIVSPLLRLLQTEYSEQALDVLDAASAIVAGKMDKHILRMSLGSKQLAKEYEKTATLYGIPEETGWSVSKPAIAATVTRNNVHAVFYTCDTSVGDQAMEFEFQGEEEEYDYGDYTAPLNRMDSTISSTGGYSGNMDRMLTVLDDLDVFFTKATHPRRPGFHGPHRRGQSTESGTTEGLNERNESISIPQLYDKKVSLILNRSLGRTPSSVSFRTSFADSFGPERRRAAVPGAPLSSVQSPEDALPPIRPEPSASSLSLRKTESSNMADSDGDISADHDKKQGEHHAESSFRLESLLRGKRRSRKSEKHRIDNGRPFHFP